MLGIGWEVAPLAALVGTPLLVAAVWTRQHKRRHQMLVDREIAWLLWHWYTGGPLERRGPLEPTDHGERIVYAICRTSAVAATCGAAYLTAGYGATPKSLIVWSYGGAAVYGLYLLAVTEWAVRRIHRTRWVLPFYWAILKDAGWKPDNDEQTSRVQEVQEVPPPRKIIRFPRLGIYGRGRGNKTRDRVLAWLHQQGWRKTARLVARCWHPRMDGVVVVCSPTFQNWDIKHQHVSEDALAKLGHGNIRVQPHTMGDLRHFQFLPGAVLPADVMWTDNDVRALMESRESELAPLLGCGHNDKPSRLSWVQSPHVAISAGTGGGKSTEIAFIAAQVLFHGGIVTILDVRQNSHRWARDLAGVRYARQIGDIYDTAMDLDAEVTRRGEIAGDLADGEEANWQRHLVVIEELNTLRPRLNNYYRTTLGGPPTKAAPALDALTSGIFMGRDLYMNCVIAAQRFQDKLLSGPAKDMFYGRLLARWEPNAWKDLARGDYRDPDMHPGRAVLCYGADENPIQMGLIEHPDLPETAGNVRRWLQMPGSRWVGLKHGGVGRTLRPVRVLTPSVQHPVGDDAREAHDAYPDGQAEGVADDAYAHHEGDVAGVLVHGSAPRAVTPGEVRQLHAPQVECPHHNGDHSEDGGQEAGSEGQANKQADYGDGEWCGVPHTPHTSTTPALVKCQSDDGENNGEGREKSLLPDAAGGGWVSSRSAQRRVPGPEGTGVMVPDPQPQPPSNGNHPQKTHSPSQTQFSLPMDEEVSMREIRAVSHPDDVDGGIEYLTLRGLASRDWCPYTYETVRKYARDEDDFPDPIEGFENPRKWSETEVRAYLLGGRQANVGDPGVYVIDPPGSATVKIGETKRLEHRVDELSLAGLGEQVVRQWFPCRDKRHAKDLETWLHRKYDRQRVSPKAEWFRKDGRLADDYQDADRLLRGCPVKLLPEVVRT